MTSSNIRDPSNDIAIGIAEYKLAIALAREQQQILLCDTIRNKLRDEENRSEKLENELQQLKDTMRSTPGLGKASAAASPSHADIHGGDYTSIVNEVGLGGSPLFRYGVSFLCFICAIAAVSIGALSNPFVIPGLVSSAMVWLSLTVIWVILLFPRRSVTIHRMARSFDRKHRDIFNSIVSNLWTRYHESIQYSLLSSLKENLLSDVKLSSSSELTLDIASLLLASTAPTVTSCGVVDVAPASIASTSSKSSEVITVDLLLQWTKAAYISLIVSPSYTKPIVGSIFLTACVEYISAEVQIQISGLVTPGSPVSVTFSIKKAPTVELSVTSGSGSVVSDYPFVSPLLNSSIAAMLEQHVMYPRGKTVVLGAPTFGGSFTADSKKLSPQNSISISVKSPTTFVGNNTTTFTPINNVSRVRSVSPSVVTSTTNNDLPVSISNTDSESTTTVNIVYFREGAAGSELLMTAKSPPPPHSIVNSPTRLLALENEHVLFCKSKSGVSFSNVSSIIFPLQAIKTVFDFSGRQYLASEEKSSVDLAMLVRSLLLRLVNGSNIYVLFESESIRKRWQGLLVKPISTIFVRGNMSMWSNVGDDYIKNNVGEGSLMNSILSNGNRYGVSFRIKQAINLSFANKIRGASSPFCEIKIVGAHATDASLMSKFIVDGPDAVFLTKVCHVTCNPEWNETFTFAIWPPSSRNLQIRPLLSIVLKDKPTDVFLGKAEIDIFSYFEGGTVSRRDGWIQLSGVKRGELYLSAIYVTDPRIASTTWATNQGQLHPAFSRINGTRGGLAGTPVSSNNNSNTSIGNNNDLSNNISTVTREPLSDLSNISAELYDIDANLMQLNRATSTSSGGVKSGLSPSPVTKFSVPMATPLLRLPDFVDREPAQLPLPVDTNPVDKDPRSTGNATPRSKSPVGVTAMDNMASLESLFQRHFKQSKDTSVYRSALSALQSNNPKGVVYRLNVVVCECKISDYDLTHNPPGGKWQLSVHLLFNDQRAKTSTMEYHSPRFDQMFQFALASTSQLDSNSIRIRLYNGSKVLGTGSLVLSDLKDPGDLTNQWVSVGSVTTQVRCAVLVDTFS